MATTPCIQSPTPTYRTFTADADHAKECDVRDHVPLIDRRHKQESTFQKYTSGRWTLSYFGFCLNSMIYCTRMCLSMTLVCLEDVGKETGVVSKEENATGTFTDRPSDESLTYVSNGTVNPSAAVAAYIPAELEGVLLSAYFYGYTIPPFFAGMVAERVGGKRVMTVSMAASSVLTLLTPMAIRLNVYLAVTLRAVLGLVSGMTVPSFMSMWTFWAPINEKAKLVAIAYSGINIGTIVANSVSGFLCSIPVDEGWPFIFYTYGGLSLLWAILWQLMIYDTPEKHPRISDKERVLLARERMPSKSSKSKAWRLPMKAMFTSVPFLTMLTTYVCDNWIYSFMGTYVPLFISDVLHFETETSGALSSLPFVSALLCTWLFAYLSDRITVSGLLSPTNNRKLFQTIGTVCPGALLCWLGFLRAGSGMLSVVLLVILNGFQSAGLSGIMLNRLELAPKYAGSLTGLTIMLGSISPIVCPLIVSSITSDGRAESWSTVFLLSAGIALFGGVIFVLFASGEEQEWAKDKTPDMTITADDDVADASPDLKTSHPA